MLSIISVIWQTLKGSEPKPSRPISWKIVKTLIKIAMFVWKILSLLHGDGEDS